MMASRAAGSLRLSGAMLFTSRPATSATRRRISRPVVPASPSMKMAGLVLLRWPWTWLASWASEAVLVVMALVPGDREQKSRARGAACERTNADSAVIAPARGAGGGVGPAMPIASSASSWPLLWGGSAGCQSRSHTRGSSLPDPAKAFVTPAADHASNLYSLVIGKCSVEYRVAILAERSAIEVGLVGLPVALGLSAHV